MTQAYFRFYAELNDFLLPPRRMLEFVQPFDGRRSIKDMIESLGVPHTEVDLILVNGRTVDFSYLVADEDRISVYPVFESLDITPLLRLRPEPLRRPCFVLDQHLGRLAAYLRLLGFDTLYRNDYHDDELAATAAGDGRILLTRDRGLLKRKTVTRGYCIRSTASREQVREVVRRFDLAAAIRPFTRCVHCNGLLVDVAKAEISTRLLPRTREEYQEFRICTGCGQIYWRGSHHRWLDPFIQSLREQPTA